MPTDIFFQTVLWDRVNSHRGWEPYAFDLLSSQAAGDILVLNRSYADGMTAAYGPQGPEYGPEPEQFGPFLEELPDALTGRLDRSVYFIRYDLPWASQYSTDGRDDLSGQLWTGRPEARLRESRVNLGTRSWNPRKAPLNLTVADTFMMDISGSEERILSCMKPKPGTTSALPTQRGARFYSHGRHASDLLRPLLPDC